MSIFNDFFDFLGDTLQDVGNVLEDTWKAVKDNPVGAITSAVLMAYGVPPAWAGAWGGAAGTAAAGGSTNDIFRAAITGGAMGYMGQAAGAAAGEAGALAQAAAAGAASAVTGAVLTGQDVVTAAKAGLILGTTMYGGQKLYKLMTPAEAIASVPADTLAQVTATSNDPLGDLIDKMGWTSSDSAVAAASKAFSQNQATTQQMLQDYIPEYVLKAASTTNNPQQYIADQMGWKDSNLTWAAAEKAVDNYQAGVKAYNSSTAGQIDNISKITGLDKVDAGLLHSEGYTSDQVNNLIKAGYTGQELVDMASTGIPASTLTSLATTTIPEQTISDLLVKGVSANDIAGVSNLVGNKTISLQNASNLLEAGFSSSQISKPSVYQNPTQAVDAVNLGLDTNAATKLLQYNGNLAKVEAGLSAGNFDATTVNNFIKQGGYSDYMFYNKNPADIFSLAENGVSVKTINELYNNNWDLVKVNNLINNGVTDANTINSHVSAPGYSTWLNSQMAVTPTSPMSLVSSGELTQADAKVLASNGYTANDVKSLISSGYTASNLADLASTGVDAQTLKVLSYTQFPETSINTFLSNGVSAQEIATASMDVSNGKLTLNSANNLLNNNVNLQTLNSLANSGTGNLASDLLNKGLSTESLQSLVDNKYNLNDVNNSMNKGFLTPEQLNSSISQGTFKDVVSTALAPHMTTVGGLTVEDLGNGQYRDSTGALRDVNGNITKYSDGTIPDWAKQTQQPVQPQQPTEVAQQPQPVEPTQPQLEVDFTNDHIVGSDGTVYKYEHYTDGTHKYTNLTTGATSNESAPLTPSDWAQTHPQQPVQPTETVAQPVQPPNTVDIGGGNFMDQYGNIVDSQGNITKAAVTPSEPITQTAGYTSEQEQQYNNLIKQGYSPQQAMDILDATGTTTTEAPTKVEVGGVPAMKGQGTPVEQYRTPGTDLATPEQVDAGQATWNAAANSWEVPTTPEVVVTAPKEPVVPVVPPVIVPSIGRRPGLQIVQQPTTPVTPTQPTTPVTPTQPTTPTVVSSSTRTMRDGSTYRDDQYSDGTTTSVLISGPSTGGTGTGTGTGGTTGPVVPDKPLTPPVTEVIPDGSSYVAPVEVTTPTTPETPVEPPVDTTTPIVPIIPPVVTPPQVDDGSYSYKWGTVKPVQRQTELNPGLINAPKFYQNTNPAQAQYYWGAHPFQPTSTFNPVLYNQIPNAPATPWGATQAARAATAQEILAQMGNFYPSLTSRVAGPVAP